MLVLSLRLFAADGFHHLVDDLGGALRGFSFKIDPNRRSTTTWCGLTSLAASIR